jgi:hypothetical protein
VTLVLELTALPSQAVRGVYTIDGVKDRMPARALFLQPDAARSFLAIAEHLTVSDVYRSAESSLAAVRSGRGAKTPGFSAHNYGLAVDVDVRASMRLLNVKTKQGLDECMAPEGWWCHRVDHQITPLKGESHHFNFLGSDFVLPRGASSTAGAIEARIVELYGAAFVLDEKAQQVALSFLRLYHGTIDGELGPLSKEALRAFQRTWRLPETSKADAKTQRTLAYVAAERRVVP